MFVVDIVDHLDKIAEFGKIKPLKESTRPICPTSTASTPTCPISPTPIATTQTRYKRIRTNLPCRYCEALYANRSQHERTCRANPAAKPPVLAGRPALLTLDEKQFLASGLFKRDEGGRATVSVEECRKLAKTNPAFRRLWKRLKRANRPKVPPAGQKNDRRRSKAAKCIRNCLIRNPSLFDSK